MRISFITTTFNKLPYLQQVYTRLVSERSSDEEIICIDGGSTDGTPEWLQSLYKDGRIDATLSESDKGESHGTNKGILLARGKYIKIITDDDCFYYPAIRACADYMDTHPEIDVLGTEGASVNWKRPDAIRSSNTRHEYNQYREQRIPFPFCGLGLLIRRSSIPLLGIFDTNFSRMDAEYSLRITSGKAVVGWYTGYTWARIMNQQSVSKVLTIRQQHERLRLNAFYGGSKYGDVLDPQPFSSRLKSLLAPILKQFRHKKIMPQRPTLEDQFHVIDTWLREANEKKPGQFL